MVTTDEHGYSMNRDISHESTRLHTDKSDVKGNTELDLVLSVFISVHLLQNRLFFAHLRSLCVSVHLWRNLRTESTSSFPSPGGPPS